MYIKINFQKFYHIFLKKNIPKKAKLTTSNTTKKIKYCKSVI